MSDSSYIVPTGASVTKDTLGLGTSDSPQFTTIELASVKTFKGIATASVKTNKGVTNV